MILLIIKVVFFKEGILMQKAYRDFHAGALDWFSESLARAQISMNKLTGMRGQFTYHC